MFLQFKFLRRKCEGSGVLDLALQGVKEQGNYMRETCQHIV
jgi:hypothetical protein